MGGFSSQRRDRTSRGHDDMVMTSCSHLRNVLLARECVDASLQRQRPVIVLPIVATGHRGVERVRRGGGGVIIFLFERGTPVGHKCVTSEPQSPRDKRKDQHRTHDQDTYMVIRGPSYMVLHGITWYYMVLPS